MRDRQDEPTPMLTAFAAVPPHISIDEINAGDAWGAQASQRMNLEEADRAPEASRWCSRC